MFLSSIMIQALGATFKKTSDKIIFCLPNFESSLPYTCCVHLRKRLQMCFKSADVETGIEELVSDFQNVF